MDGEMLYNEIMKLNNDSPIFVFIHNLVDFVVLNVLFLLLCLPIFTIGASLTALHSITLKEARGEGPAMLRGFLSAFKANIRRATPMFLIYAAAGGILSFSAVFWFNVGGFGFVVAALMAVGFIALLLSFLYAFALLARFENSAKATMLNGLYIAATNIGHTLALLAINVIIIAAIVFVDFGGVFFLLMGFAFSAYCKAFIFKAVFKKYGDDLDEGET